MATLDELLKQADQGVAVGTTQRYFKPGAQPQPAPPAPQPAVAPLNQGSESEKEMIDRILGRKKQSMSDAPGELAAGQMYAGGPSLRDLLRIVPTERQKLELHQIWPDPDERSMSDRVRPPTPAPAPAYTPQNPIPDPGVAALRALQDQAMKYGPAVNQRLHGLVDQYNERLVRRP